MHVSSNMKENNLRMGGMKHLALVALLSCGTMIFSTRMEQLKEGNLALPASQQPGPLFLYGQNIVDKGDIQAEFYMDVHQGINRTFIDVLPGLLYGVTDSLSLYFNIPFTPRYQINCHRSSGMEDIFVQAEYAAFSHDTPSSTSMVTLVGALYFPTGSIKKNPPTGFGAPSFFLGATASYLSAEWYVIASPAVWLTTSNGDTKYGNQFFYQASLGRNVWSKPGEWIITAMVELFGIYDRPDKIDGSINPNSGSNLVHIGPTIWLSTKRFFGQAGILCLAAQSYRGCQNRNQFLFALDLGWKFNWNE